MTATPTGSSLVLTGGEQRLTRGRARRRATGDGRLARTEVLDLSNAVGPNTQAVSVNPDGDVRELDLGGGADQLVALYRAIGCETPDMLTVTPQLQMWVDDQGVVNGSAVNPIATALVAATPRLRNQTIRGTVVFTSTPDPRGDVTSPAPAVGCRSCTPTTHNLEPVEAAPTLPSQHRWQVHDLTALDAADVAPVNGPRQPEHAGSNRHGPDRGCWTVVTG